MGSSWHATFRESIPITGTSTYAGMSRWEHSIELSVRATARGRARVSHPVRCTGSARTRGPAFGPAPCREVVTIEPTEVSTEHRPGRGRRGRLGDRARSTGGCHRAPADLRPRVIGAGGGHPVRHDTTQGIGAVGCLGAAGQAAGRLPPRGPPRPAPRPTPWSATPSIGRALGSWTGSLHPAYMTLPRTRGRAAQCASSPEPSRARSRCTAWRRAARDARPPPRGGRCATSSGGSSEHRGRSGARAVRSRPRTAR